MELVNRYVLGTFALYALSYLFYLRVSHGLGHKAEFLQLRRFLPCAICAILPSYLANTPLFSGPFLAALLIGVNCIVTYPLLYYLTYRNVSSDFGFHLDVAFGMYLVGFFTDLPLLIMYFNIIPKVLLIIVACLEFLFLVVPFREIVYYLLYHNCINENGMMLLQRTHKNEVIEFFQSLPKAFVAAVVLITTGLFIFLVWANLSILKLHPDLSTTDVILLVITFIFMVYYFWKPKKGLFKRLGIVELYFNVKEYFATSELYAKNSKERLRDLQVTPSKPPFTHPSTIIMVIGESESRDFMSAFVDYPRNTTPWLKAQKGIRNFLFFPKTYACASQTVPVLERALTEFNQYDGNKFYTSCSVVDIARAAGYHTYWYSNQGYLGDADTPITLVAKSADLSRWTAQDLNKVHYDNTLLGYFEEINPQENNFIVFHLKGSHFNYINRYPQEFARFSKPNKYDLLPNYEDSIAYTDYILQQIYTYAKENLNLEAMVYFSDHGGIPTTRRNPDSKGFFNLRIPLFTYFSDEYIKLFPDTYNTLKDHQDMYFTNDLIYELMCGVFHITSNHYDQTNSLASPLYKHTIDTLKTYCGQLYIKDDIFNQTPR
jgi:heptose-I-phosphate ethanolaminephosphotransferase